MVGGVVVYWGLRVEKTAEKLMPPSSFKPDLFQGEIEAAQKEMERGWKILMTGIVMEVVAALFICIFSGLESAELGDKAEQARKDAAEAKLLATEIELTNAQIWQTNMVLRSNLAILELKVQPRIITSEQVTNFIFLTEKIKKIPIAVSIGQEGFDTETFAHQIRTMFSRAGFGVAAGAGVWDIKRDPTRIFSFEIGFPIVEADAAWIFPSEAGISDTSKIRLSFERTNKVERPIVTTTNETDIYNAIAIALKQVGIKVIACTNMWTPPNGHEIYIPIKGQF